MADTGYTRSPKLSKGALVEIAEDLVVPTPHIIPFQYNPETLSRTITPWNPLESDSAQKGQVAPTVQPFDPKEQISLTLELDASDQLEDGDPLAMEVGVGDRLAALEKLTRATKGVLGDVVASFEALTRNDNSKPPDRPSVPIVLFVWGRGRILPVRVTTFSVEEQLFSPSLAPVQAKVTVQLDVLTPDVFKCQDGPGVKLAVGAYRFYRLKQNALALAHVARSPDAIRSLLPF
jgi:hypothetical protein